MAKIMKPVRYDEELIDLIDKRSKGENFAEKVHSTLYYCIKHEEDIRTRIKVLEEKESQMRKKLKV